MKIPEGLFCRHSQDSKIDMEVQTAKNGQDKIELEQNFKTYTTRL